MKFQLATSMRLVLSRKLLRGEGVWISDERKAQELLRDAVEEARTLPWGIWAKLPQKEELKESIEELQRTDPESVDLADVAPKIEEQLSKIPLKVVREKVREQIGTEGSLFEDSADIYCEVLYVLRGAFTDPTFLKRWLGGAGCIGELLPLRMDAKFADDIKWPSEISLTTTSSARTHQVGIIGTQVLLIGTT